MDLPDNPTLNNMKKIFSLMAILAVFTSCNKDANTPNNGGNDQQSATLIGTWNGVFEEYIEVITFNADNSYSCVGDMYQEFGTFTNNGTSFTQTMNKRLTREWQRDATTGAPLTDEKGNYLYTDWQEAELSASEKEPYTTEYKLDHNGDVLLLSTGAGDDRSAAISPYVPYLKDNATTLSNINELQGKWYWLSQFGNEVMVRCVLIVNGDQAEYIITPWGERYVGKVTYEKGVMTMASPAYTTTRWEDPTGDYEHMNEEHPESSEWRTPTGDPNDWYGAFIKGFRIAVVLGGDGQLYSIAANLPANYTKQQ